MVTDLYHSASPMRLDIIGMLHQETIIPDFGSVAFTLSNLARMLSIAAPIMD